MRKSAIEYAFIPSTEIVHDWMAILNPSTGFTIYEQMSNDAADSYPSDNPGATTPWPIVFPHPAFTAQLDNEFG